MNQHWLVRRITLRMLWILFAAVLAASIALQPFVRVLAHFGFDGSLGFAAWYGFVSCAAMIVFAKALGWLLKRPDTYYTEREEGPHD